MMQAELARRRLLLLAPLGVAAAGGLAFWTMLDRMGQGRFDPHDIGNPMLGKPMPDFDLPAVATGAGFSSKELRDAARTKPVLLNQGVQLWGIAYEDKPENTKAFLDKYGNPYARLAADTKGGTFIDFGLFGVPESFIIDAHGRIAWHLAGPISEDLIDRQVTPALSAAK
jgi:cytochrome c biogenesis protein CcmG/thiol:disulfide interchange protein DsbE